MARFNIYRNGSVHVQADLCDTCIYRKDGREAVGPERVAEMAAKAVRDDSAIVCHKTLGTRKNAVCRGFFNRPKKDVYPLRMALQMEVITFVKMKEHESSTGNLQRGRE